MANLDVEVGADEKQSCFPAAQFEHNCQWYYVSEHSGRYTIDSLLKIVLN